MKATEHRLACAWYVKYPLDAYALGPIRFPKPVAADEATEHSREMFGELPSEVWPDGPVEEVDEYEFDVME